MLALSGDMLGGYAASWQLPQPDFHWLVDDSFRTHQRAVTGTVSERSIPRLCPKIQDHIPIQLTGMGDEDKGLPIPQ